MESHSGYNTRLQVFHRYSLKFADASGCLWLRIRLDFFRGWFADLGVSDVETNVFWFGRFRSVASAKVAGDKFLRLVGKLLRHSPSTLGDSGSTFLPAHWEWRDRQQTRCAGGGGAESPGGYRGEGTGSRSWFRIPLRSTWTKFLESEIGFAEVNLKREDDFRNVNLHQVYAMMLARCRCGDG